MNARPATSPRAARAVVTAPAPRKTCGSAASAGRPHLRHGKRPAPKPAKSFPIRTIHDPRERVMAARMVRVREYLRYDVPAFARLCGVTPAALEAYEAQARPWPSAAIRAALPRLSEACAAFHSAIEDSVGLITELEEETRW